MGIARSFVPISPMCTRTYVTLIKRIRFIFLLINKAKKYQLKVLCHEHRTKGTDERRMPRTESKFGRLFLTAARQRPDSPPARRWGRPRCVAEKRGETRRKLALVARYEPAAYPASAWERRRMRHPQARVAGKIPATRIAFRCAGAAIRYALVTAVHEAEQVQQAGKEVEDGNE